MSKVFQMIPDKNGMERGTLQLLNFIILFGIVLTVTTAIALPNLDWGIKKKVVPVVKESTDEYLIPRRSKKFSFNN